MSLRSSLARSRAFPGIALLVLTLAWAAPCRAASASPALPDGGRIPDLHGTTLAGQPVDLPKMLAGRPAVLILGFSRDAQAEATAWGKRLAVDFYASPDVLYYELPMLGGVPRLMRGFVMHEIAKEVSDRGKAHFVPVVNDEARWRQLAHVRSDREAYVLLVDGQGEVRWVTSGALTEDGYKTLRSDLDEIRASSPRP